MRCLDEWEALAALASKVSRYLAREREKKMSSTLRRGSLERQISSASLVSGSTSVVRVGNDGSEEL